MTTAEEYNKNLHIINNVNPPIYAALPKADNIYNIDTQTREIDAPKFLAVEKDHQSETIYFIIDRFVDYMDLATTCCIITYTNAEKKSYIYRVPFYDIYSKAKDDKMLLPWCLDHTVTSKKGKVEFALQFFKTGRVFDDDIGGYKKIITYSFNTLPAHSEVLNSMKMPENIDSMYDIEPGQYTDLLAQISASKEPLYWTILG